MVWGCQLEWLVKELWGYREVGVLSSVLVGVVVFGFVVDLLEHGEELVHGGL